MEPFGHIQADSRGLRAGIQEKTERTGAIDVNAFDYRIVPSDAQWHGIASGSYNRHEHAYQSNSSLHAARITALVSQSNDGEVIFSPQEMREQ